jgi:hypothetical protein
MTWVHQCETFISKVMISPTKQAESILNEPSFSLSCGSNDLSNRTNSFFHGEKIAIVVQGGLAPVAVLLAARNPNLIHYLIFTSPPTYRDMTNIVSELTLQYNYNALKGDGLGYWHSTCLNHVGLYVSSPICFCFQIHATKLG